MTEVDALRAATREAHEAMKDMRLLMRDVRVLISELQDCARSEVNQMLTEAVREGMEAHQQAISDAIDAGTAMVYARFAEIGDVLMGEDRKSVNAGQSIKQLVARWSEAGP